MYVPQSNTWFLGPPIYIPNMSTDHATPSVTIGHIHAALPNNIHLFMSQIHQPSILSICYRTTVCLSVCDVGVLWPNGWMDQDATWYGGRTRPRLHSLRGRRSSPAPKGHIPQFSAHVCSGQTAGWIKMPHGREVGLCPGNIVLDGDRAPSTKRGHNSLPLFSPCLLWPNGWMDQDATWYRGRPRSRPHCVRRGPSSTC